MGQGYDCDRAAASLDETPRSVGHRAAHWYSSNWSVGVVPVVPGSRRAILGATGPGHERASAEQPTIDGWWKRWPWADAAVRAAEQVVLLDLDAKHGIDGRETIGELEQRYGELPDAPTATTPHGGEHRYYRAPDGGVRSSVAKLGAAVDVRGNGSLLFPPPCRGYKYLIGYAATEVPLAELPAAWVDAIHRLEDARGAFGEPFRLPDFMGKGERNDTLFRQHRLDARSLAGLEEMLRKQLPLLGRAHRADFAPPVADGILCDGQRRAGHVRRPSATVPAVPTCATVCISKFINVRVDECLGVRDVRRAPMRRADGSRIRAGWFNEIDNLPHHVARRPGS
jgi:hypothetical protein